NRTERELPQGTLATLWEEQVAQHPYAVALVGELELTYEQLNERANKLSHWLIGQGVGPEQMVGVSMARSPEMMVALLAIIKAGAAYVPLDPEYPAARLALMSEDAKPVVVLTADEVLGVPADLPASNPTPRGSVDNACYAMYTSGSTGRPKGIVVGQRAVIRLVRNG